MLGLGAEREARIATASTASRAGAFFRYPNVRLNQINWNAELYAYAAALTGDPELLRNDYRRHVRRFIAGVRRPLHEGGARTCPPATASSTRPPTPARAEPRQRGVREHHAALHAWYEQALRAGMRPLPAADMAILRAWAARVQFGYWMHNGC